MTDWTPNGSRLFRPFPDKIAATKAILAAGFTEHVETSESGDWGPGSREYYCKPGAERNRYGYPLIAASVSKLDDRWMADIPGMPLGC